MIWMSGGRGAVVDDPALLGPAPVHADDLDRHVVCGDLVPTNGQMRAFKRFCRDFLAGRAFDQLISEGEDNSKWNTGTGGEGSVALP